MWVYILAAMVAVPIVLALAILALVLGAVAAMVLALIGMANLIGRRIGGMFRGNTTPGGGARDGRRNVRIIQPGSRS